VEKNPFKLLFSREKGDPLNFNSNAGLAGY
jgi:hypothetical protein